MVRLQRDIGPGGLLIANPVPEAKALDARVRASFSQVLRYLCTSTTSRNEYEWSTNV
jgi:hypothetical protein